ncbi:hypothetical protein BKA64DRAFT_762543 [Cadophora sp. MPI-SDFR-AT-0126]|nr:hypothetical protein BKA64DRAFT_762543 [Leotiomycetes sp. MPI-SDFR-AT-0126]
MPNTRASPAPTLRRSGRNKIPTSSSSKTVGVTKKKDAAKPKPARKAKKTDRAIAVLPTANKTSKTSTRKRSGGEDEAPAPKAKRAKTSEPKAKAAVAPLLHLQSLLLTEPESESESEPEPEPGPGPEPENQQLPPPPALVHSLPAPPSLAALPSVPALPAPPALPSLLPPLPPPQPAPYQSIYSANPSPPPPASTAPGYLSLTRHQYRQIVPARHIPGYEPAYEPPTQRSTAALRSQGDQKRANHLANLSYQRQQEARLGYVDDCSDKQNPLHKRLRMKEKVSQHHGDWRRRVRQERERQHQVDVKDGVEKWKMSRVHEKSPLRQECGDEWEMEEMEEQERLRVEARERFEAEKRAGLVEDAELYGEDYDPYAEDY